MRPHMRALSDWPTSISLLPLLLVAFPGWGQADGLLHVHGKTLFPLGFYELPAEEAGLKALADAGANVVRCENRTDLNRVQRVGIFGWLPLDLAQGATDELRSKVDSVKDHPALAVWEGPDEVVWNFTGASRLYRILGIHKRAGAWRHRDPEAVAYAEDQAKTIIPNMRAAADYIRQVDKQGRPIWINEARDSDRDYVRKCLEFVDITGCDLYPVKESKRDIATIGEATRDWRDIGAGKPVRMVLQAFSWDELGDYFGAKTTVYPSFAESRFMAYDAIANGAAGVMYWGSTYAKSPAFRESILAVINELNSLQPFLVEPDVPNVRLRAKSGGDLGEGVHVKARRAGDQWLILLVGEKRSNSSDIVIEGLTEIAGKQLQCLYSPETFTVSADGKVVIHLDPLSVRLLATDRRWESSMATGREFTGSARGS